MQDLEALLLYSNALLNYDLTITQHRDMHFTNDLCDSYTCIRLFSVYGTAHW
jgi:hypothetical protein